MPVKNNLGNDLTGLAYTIGTSANDAPVVQWELEPITESIDQVLEQDNGNGALASLVDEAKDWLIDALSSGPLETTELQKLAKMAGHAWATVKRAKGELKIKAFKKDFQGGWAWKLPDTNSTQSPKVLKEPQDAHSKSMSTFGNREHLRGAEAEYLPWAKDQEGGIESVVLPMALNKPFVANVASASNLAECEQPGGAGSEDGTEEASI